MYCRKCGREIPDDSVMCGYCGTPVNPNLARVQAEGGILQVQTGLELLQ